MFLASAAISSLYYIANPSDRSTKTQRLFLIRPSCRLYLEAPTIFADGSPKTSTLLHLIQLQSGMRSPLSAAGGWIGRNGSWAGTGSVAAEACDPSQEWRLVCALSLFPFAGLAFIRPSMQMLLRSSSKPTAACTDAKLHHWLTDRYPSCEWADLLQRVSLAACFMKK